MLGIQKIFTSSSHKENDHWKTNPQESGSRVGKVDDDVGSSSHRCFRGDDTKSILTVDEEEHHTRLGEHAAKLWKHQNLTDVIIKLRGESYPAHKTVLSCYSRYFEVLLLTDSHCSVINLDSKSISNEAFFVLLQFMYTSSLVITCQNIGEVFTAAKKLQMDKAVNICTKVLNGASKQEVHSVYTYVTAKQLGLKDAWVRALRTMCKRFEQIVGTQEYQDLKQDQVMEYLSSDTLATRSEVLVFLAALKWISVQYLDREQFAVEVIGCVRFPLMTLHEILACHTPPLLPGITEKPQIKAMLLRATCFIAATSVNEGKRFQRYNCAPRTYLMERESFILWDPNIFDPELYALYEEQQAATSIQAAYRGYQTRKSISQDHEAASTIQANYRGYQTRKSINQEHEAARTIQANYRGYQTRKSISKGHGRDFYDETDSDDSSQIEEEKKDKLSFADALRKSVTSIFKKASIQVEGTERQSHEKDERKEGERGEFGRTIETEPPPPWVPEVSSNTDALAGTVNNVPKEGQKGRDERIGFENGEFSRSIERQPPQQWIPEARDSSNTETSQKKCKEDPKDGQKEKEKRKGRYNGEFGRTIETEPPPPWIPEVSSNTDALAGTVKNVPKGGQNVFSEDPYSKDKKKHLEDRYAHPPYNTVPIPIQQAEPPPWVPEVSGSSSSLDALAGTVVNMTKNLDVAMAKSKGKLVFPGDHHFQNNNKQDSLDSILTKESESKTTLKSEYGSNEGLFRAIIVTGGLEDKDEDDSESDSKTDGYRSSPTCCGGQDNGKLVFQYDPAANQWSTIGQMPKSRHHHRLVYLDNILYVIGGCDPGMTKTGKMVPTNTCFSFDLSSKKWKKLSKMRHCRMYHAAAALGGKIYVVGGKDYKNSMLDSIEVFDPKSGKWQELPDVLSSPTMHLGLCGHKGRLWIIGGMVQSEGKIKFVKDVMCYCPDDKTWSKDMPKLPTPRAFLAVIECVNRVYVVGGTSSTDTDDLDSMSDMLYYDEIRKIWRNTTPMPEPCHSVGVAACGKSIFVLGGRYNQEVLDQVVVFTESPEHWYRCSSLPVTLSGFATAAIPKVIESK